LAVDKQAGVEERGVLVGISGGVDSAVAALLLKEEGYRVTGVTLRLWSDPASVDRRTACSVEALEHAKSVAATLGIPHLIVDASEAFQAAVVRYFIQEHEGGCTPNPCVKCNSRFRFGLFSDIARREGLAHIATGHYARMIGDPPGLARGVDPGKDQSYVLAEVAPELLRQCIFPLGGMRKAAVKARAEKAGLAGRVVPESQEICFIPDHDHRRFLKERLGERPGALVDGAGRRLGKHSGVYNFTIGQRKRLGIAGAGPLYVIEVIGEGGEVVVGPAAKLAVGSLEIGDAVHHRAAAGENLTVQWRSSGDALPARLAGPRTILLDRPAMAVSPGQTAVLYDGDMVVLAGTILSTRPWPGSAHRST